MNYFKYTSRFIYWKFLLGSRLLAPVSILVEFHSLFRESII